MLGDTVDELRTIALDASDARGYFPAMYARVTARVDDAIGEGRFDDGPAMADFARTFAAWYVRPAAGLTKAPRCWAAAAAAADDGGLLIVQHLLLGINAHVNHDLPLVVCELADRRGDLAPLRGDFDAMNDLLAETMPDVMRDLGRVSRWVNLVASRGGGRAFDFSLRAAREQAWGAAERRWPMSRAQREAAAGELDDLVTVLAAMIAHPGRPARWLVPIGRRFEQREPTRVTRRLLGPLA